MVGVVLHMWKCQNIFHRSHESRETIDTNMFPKAALLLVFLSGVAVSLILTILPNISSLFTLNTHQLDASEPSHESAGCHAQSAADNQLMLDTLKMHQTALTQTRKEKAKLSGIQNVYGISVWHHNGTLFLVCL